MSEEENKSKKKNTLRMILLIIAILILICSASYIIYYFYNNYMAGKEYDSVTLTTGRVTTVENLSENPIDFVPLKEQNDEIYAWLKIEDTNVDYPIVQSRMDDEFYLKHNALDKKWQESGAIYTEGANNTDFSDPITVIYGHNGYKDTMFTTLHNFEKQEFFDEHPYFYIYEPQRKLTYQVISAFKYDDRHIMNSFNFYAGDDLQNFQQTVLNPDPPVRNVRENLDVSINKNSKIVVLSTCITGQKSNRYLVCGVLVKDEKTN